MTLSFPRFPQGPSTGNAAYIDDKKYVWDGYKWELIPLSDSFTNELPIDLVQDTVRGEGRNLDHSFTIKKLFGYENIT